MNCSHGKPLELKCWDCVSEGLAAPLKSMVKPADIVQIADPFKKVEKQVDKKGVLLHTSVVS